MHGKAVSAPHGLMRTSEVMAAQLVDLNEEVKRLREMFSHVSKRGWCRRCKREVFYIYHIDTDRYVEYDADGAHHSATCPNALQLRGTSNAG